MTGIERFDLTLPHGITLACRAAGEPGRPLMLFLHGFPQGAFVWDALLLHFSQPRHGGYRCVAPNLRGYAGLAYLSRDSQGNTILSSLLCEGDLGDAPSPVLVSQGNQITTSGCNRL